MNEEENPILDYLNTFHQMTSKSQEVIHLIDVLATVEDYSEVTPENWHEMLAVLKTMIQSQQDMLKEHVEYRLRVTDRLSYITRQFNKE